MASRLWWLLTYLGHEKVCILNGGFTAWKQAGLPTTDAIPVFESKEFLPHLQSDMLVSMADVKNRIESGADFLLIDSREPIRYAGIEEPIDRKAGHIPTAVNSFWMDGVSAEGVFQGEKEQEARFCMFDKEKETIVYCGSGVTACPNVLALKMAGFQNVKLYAGSWSDWISYDENIVEKNAKDKMN
jgi:thiosulfate/3-mercaptopyruvate sulfurtransferase